MKQNIFVTGIGTGIGKTIISAILVESLEADYWKPIQAGNLEQTDRDLILQLVSNPRSKFHNETYRLSAALSPHAAAKIDSVDISLSSISLPATDNRLVIEGAGGLMVPLNEEHLVIDLISHLKAPVILVSKNYLGSINHTLLSIEALQRRGTPIIGIIFNGPEVPASQEIILKRSGLKYIGSLHEENLIDRQLIKRYAAKFKDKLNELL